MLAHIHHWDIAAFYLINNSWSHPALDLFFRLVTEFRNYVIPAGILAVYLWLKGGTRGRSCVLAVMLCAAITDGLSSRLVKPWIARPRPCVALPNVLTPHGPRRTFSFPSNHATNMAAASVIVGMNYPRWSWALVLLTFLVGLSRVYLGLHYPSDILGGLFIGSLMGWIFWKLSRRFEAKP